MPPRLSPTTACRSQPAGGQAGGHTSGEQAATRACRPARSSGRSASSRARLVQRHRAALVLEGQVDDLDGLQAAGRQLDAARGYAVRARRRRRGAQVDQPVGDLGPPAGDVERGQRLGGLEQRRAQRPVGLADVGQLAARPRAARAPHRPPAPARRGTRPVTAPASSARSDRLPGLERGGVEARPARRGRAGRRRPAARAPARCAPRAAQAPRARSPGAPPGRRRAPRRRGGPRRRPRTASSDGSVTTWPRSHAVSHQARRADAGSAWSSTGSARLRRPLGPTGCVARSPV